ncbi:hypothetical protein D3C73_308660 [compost metagenome]
MAKIDKLASLASEHLQQGEQILVTVMGAYETKIMGQDTLKTGVLLATNCRLFFFGKRTFGFDSESFPYETISSFEYSKGLMGSTVSFFASGNKVKMKWINKGDVSSFISTVQSNLGKKNSNSNSNNPLMNDVADQIKKLADLRDSGVLTEEEFTHKKKQLLNL